MRVICGVANGAARITMWCSLSRSAADSRCFMSSTGRSYKYLLHRTAFSWSRGSFVSHHSWEAPEADR